MKHIYVVSIREVHVSNRTIESASALTKEEAITLAMGDIENESLEYSHTMDNDHHIVTEVHERYGDNVWVTEVE